MTRFRAKASTTEKPRGDGSKIKGSSDAKAAGQKRVPTPTALVTATEKPAVTRKKDEVKGAEDIGKEKLKGKGKDVSMVAKGKEKKMGDSERRGVLSKAKEEGVKPERSGVLAVGTPREKKVEPGKAETKGKESVVKAPLEGKAKLSMLEGKAKERGEMAKVPPTAATLKEVGKAKLGTKLISKPQKVQASAPAPAPAAKKAPAAVLSKELKPKPTKPEVPRVGVKRPRQDIEEDETEQGTEDEESVHLHGFSTDEDDSSDEEGIVADAIDASALPSAAKDDAAVRKRLDKAKRIPTDERGVVYLGRIPHGMYEDQLRSYFTQFGEVTRLRLSRNKKSGRSKSYAFIEFASSSVAQIVTETMHNYLLAGRLLVCHLIPKDQVHPELWVGANRRYRVVPRGRISRVQHNSERSDLKKAKVERRLLKRQRAKKRKMEHVGLNYDFEAVAYKKVEVVKT